jgi:NAD-dependent deacetylase
MGNENTAVSLLRRARYAVALTGAGISTRSGIPDFRSPESGLWERYNPAEVASIYGFRHDPRRFYDWIRPLARIMLEAQPNAAHIALARLEAMGKLQAVITQNIDMLHTRAGSHTVYELHGHLRDVTCIHCFAVYPAQPLIDKFIESNEIPTCPACGNVLKPNVILYGEQLPAQALIARQNGASLIFVNLSETPLDSLAEVIIHADVADVLPQIVSALENESDP